MGTIPSETIEQIAAVNDIVEVIGSYFPLKRAGSNFKTLCPFHQEKTPSFTVSPSRQTFHCFGCGAGGSVFRFVMDYEHVDFPSAVHKLAARAGITIVQTRGAAEEDRQYETRRKLLKLHAEAAEWFQENLIKKEVGEPARKYLRRRGITGDIAKHWQLGYAPDEWNEFGSWAKAQGYDARELIASGLIKIKDESDSAKPQTSNLKPQTSYDRFRDRIMFPICNDVGEVIAFSGRLLKNEEVAAKYVNSPETPLFRKGNVLFGLHKSKRALIEANCAIVCEGQLDLITLFEAGITNVVAPQGTAFTETQARTLKRFVNEVVLCFDADHAGRQAGDRSLTTFVQHFGVRPNPAASRGRGPAERSLDSFLQNDLVVRIVEMPPGQDPDTLVRKEGKEAFMKRITDASNFIDYWIEREATATDLTSLAAKMQLVRHMAEAVSHARDRVMQQELANKISARIGIPLSDFESVLPKQRSQATADMRDPPMMTAAPPHDIAMLCLLALRDGAARNFLHAQRWREILEQLPNADILVRILESELRPDDPASLNAFMATLSPEEERLVSSWLLHKMPAATETVVEKWWQGICQGVLRRRLETAKSQIKVPGLSAGEELNLQKQILDLQEQLHEFSRPVGGG
jgi:DNA primase